MAGIPAEPAPGAPAALDGIRVLDFTRVLAGPYCTMMLSELGAEIVKIENPAGGDESRSFMPPERNGVATYFMHLNRNKKSVVIDLAKEDGRAAARALADHCDVLIENFRPGVMDRLGLGHEQLSERNPGLVYCSISGYGSEGELAARPGFDPVIQAESGLMSLTGEPDGQPMRIGVSMVDIMAGMYAGQGVLAALVARGRTGIGQRLDVCLLDTGVNMLSNFGAAYLATGYEAPRIGNGNLVSQPGGVYQAADGPFVLTTANDRQYRALCLDVLEDAALADDPAYRTNPDRLTNVDSLSAALNARFAARDRDAWVARIRAAGIPAGPIRTIPEALESDDVKQRGLIWETKHPVAGDVRLLRQPIRMRGTPGRPPVPSAGLGEHTARMLTDVAGYDAATIAALRAAGVIPEEGA